MDNNEIYEMRGGELMKKIKVCKRCSGHDIKELKKFSKQQNIKLKVGCIGKCRHNHPELTDKFIGLEDGNFVICDSKEEFFDYLKLKE